MTARRTDGSNARPDGDRPVQRDPQHTTSAAVPLSAFLACAFLATLPFPALIGLPGGASVALLIMIAASPIWFAVARARTSPFDRMSKVAISVSLACAGFLIVWSLISTYGAVAPLRASRYLATLVSGFAIYFLVRSTITQKRITLFVDILATGLAVTATVSLMAYVVGPLHDLVFRGTDRAAGLFKNPNQFGMAISTAMPATFALLLSGKKRWWFRASCLLLMLLGLVASGSKTNLLLAWVAIVVVLICHSYIAYKGAKRVGMLAVYLIGAVAFTALGILALGILNPRALGILLSLVGNDGEVDSLMTRGFLWTYSINEFLNDPIMGQGAGQQIDIFYREADVSHSHNVLLDYMRSLGAPGLIGVATMIGAVAVMCVLTIYDALRVSQARTAARLMSVGLSLSALIYVAANMSSDSFGPSTSPYFWVFAYLAMASRRLIRVVPLRTSDTPRTDPVHARFPELRPQHELA